MKKTPVGNEQLMQEFIDQLLIEQGFSKEDPEIWQELRLDLEKRLDYHLDNAIADNIPTDKVDEFSGILESGSEKNIKDFIYKVIPNVESVITEALGRFRDVYLGV